LLGARLARPERDKARSIVAESGAIEQSLLVARRYAELAAEAVGGVSTSRLCSGFATLAHSMVDGIPLG
jgi:geranylgeranyl pyrophosphate synthase